MDPNTPTSNSLISNAVLPILNADFGESYCHWKMGNDENLIEYVDWVNIACGAHAGDPQTMLQSIKLAKTHQKKVGAHPGYADLPGFGRKSIPYSYQELYALLITQISALHGCCIALDVPLNHVKPHGALYNDAYTQNIVCEAIIDSILDLKLDVFLIAQHGSILSKLAKNRGLKVVEEAFADRRYEASGKLLNRSHPAALISSPQIALEQVKSMHFNQQVKSLDGTILYIQASTICIHGDAPHALSLAQTIAQWKLHQTP